MTFFTCPIDDKSRNIYALLIFVISTKSAINIRTAAFPPVLTAEYVYRLTLLIAQYSTLRFLCTDLVSYGKLSLHKIIAKIFGPSIEKKFSCSYSYPILRV